MEKGFARFLSFFFFSFFNPIKNHKDSIFSINIKTGHTCFTLEKTLKNITLYSIKSYY